MNLFVREIQPTDFHNGFLESLEALAPVDINWGEFQQILSRREQGESYFTFVAVLNGRIVGTASLLLDQKFIHGGGLAGRVEDVAVHREFQGRGAGKVLLKHLLRFARDRGCYKITLACDESVSGFYEKLGFYPNGMEMRFDVVSSGPTFMCCPTNTTVSDQK